MLYSAILWAIECNNYRRGAPRRQLGAPSRGAMLLLLLPLLLLGSARVTTPLGGSTSDASVHTVVIGEVRHTVRRRRQH